MLGPVAGFLIFVPFIVIIWLANIADRRRGAGRPSNGLAALTYGLIIVVYVAMSAIGALFAVLAALPADQAAGLQSAEGGIASPSLVALGLIVPSFFGMLLLLPPVRRAFAFIIPVDPRSTTHAVALSYTSLVAVNLLTILGMGIGNLANSLGSGPANGQDLNLLLGLWTQEISWFALGIVGVGLLSRRGPLAGLERLGIVPPTLRQVLAGLGAGVVLAAVALAILNIATNLGVPMDQGVQRLSERLIGPLSRTAPGILTIGVAAALGEETLFRGALQPRFGLVFTSVLFALLHSTYGLSLYTVVVLIVGFALGLVRQRFNTSTSMITHATYNIVQALMDMLS